MERNRGRFHFLKKIRNLLGENSTLPTSYLEDNKRKSENTDRRPMLLLSQL